jgi:hypothetical protein
MKPARNHRRTIASTLAALAIATLVMSGDARASEHFDMAELSCGDLARTYGNEFAVIDAWLSGYFHGRLNKTVVNPDMVIANSLKVVSFCKANPNVTVIKAVEQLIDDVNAKPTTPAQ